MPYSYHSQELRESARRGRRAIMTHPDWRSSNHDWSGCGIDMIADILHALNSRMDLQGAFALGEDGEEFVSGESAVLSQARHTFQTDLEEEPTGEPIEPTLQNNWTNYLTTWRDVLDSEPTPQPEST